MQEKVHSAPPPVIKMVEGKPPPDSWVTENIVQYLQDRTQSSFLKDVLTYVKSLQAEQLAQMKSKILSLKESFSSVPDSGTADEIAGSSLFNATQGLIKTQMESLEKLLLLMSQADPKLASTAKGMLSELQKMGTSFPALTPGQMQNLNTILQELGKYAARFSPRDQRSFWNLQINMLKAMLEENKGNLQEYHDEIQELQAKMRMLDEITGLLKEMKQALTATPPSPKQFQEFIQNLQSLANRYGELDFEQQQALSTLFGQLAQFKTKAGESLTQVVADALIGAKLAAFLQSNPQATSGQCAAFLKTFLKESNLQSSNLSFLHSLGDEIEDVLSKKDFPATKGYSGQPFATDQNGKIQLNEGFQKDILSAYAPDPSSVAALEKSSNTLTQAVSLELNLCHKKLEGLSETFNNLSNVQEHMGKGAAWAVGKSYSAGEAPGLGDQDGDNSLPNQFAHAIINHYMPGQQAYLEQLAMMLFLDNQGAQFGNTLLSTIDDFNSAGTNYDFSNSLHPDGGPNTFSGSVTNAQNQLNNEKANVNNDINKANTAYNQAQNAIDKINGELKGPPPLSADQRQVLEDQLGKLQQFQGDLKASLAQLNQLKTALDAITIGPAQPPNNDPTKHFEVYGVKGPGDPPPFNPPDGWQEAISSGERLVINGDPSVKPPAFQGGLVNIASEVTAFQQNYSDQGQSQQMQLQMRMTEIQQEWTVVSTALQLLNQMYMSVAQGIYK